MAERCSNCGSADVEALAGALGCLDCGQQTEYGNQSEQRVVADSATYSVDPAGEAPTPRESAGSDLEPRAPAPAESEPGPVPEAS